MKRKFRGGAGQGPKKSGGKQKSNHKSQSHKDQGSASGGTKKFLNQTDTGGSKIAKSARSAGGSSGKSSGRRDIKNARGLKDVLGIGGGERSGGPRRQFDSSSVRSSTPPAAAAQKTGTKITQIMTFQPPGTSAAPSREAPKESPARPQTKIQHRDTYVPEAKVPKPMSVPGKSGRSYASASGSAPIKKKHREQVRRTESSDRPGDQVYEGIVKRHPDGFGFVVVDHADVPDIYVPRHSMVGIMTNDRVAVALNLRGGRAKFKPTKEDRLSGEITHIISRAHQRIVGRYLAVDRRYGMIQDENRGWGADLRILVADSMNAVDGQMVAVEVLQFPDYDKEFLGRVVSIIGDVEDPINDVIRVAHQGGIPMQFSDQAKAEARRYGGKVSEAERKGREDITHLPICTIDGATARDFDDAVFVEKTSGGFHLVVAIADVSHYVKPGTHLDTEAFERGTSTYFPNYVVPMLPEELSNELCSLNPFVPRLCFCCEMTIDWQGQISEYRFFEGVMESKARVTYGEAQEVIDGGHLALGKGRDQRHLPAIEESIHLAADLAKILMAKRFREGSLDLEIPETQVVVDASGETSDIIRSERLFAHRLIEELMLVTNICTARFLDEAEMPGIYRVHEEPDPESIRSLQRYLWNLGGSRSVMGSDLAKKLSKALEAMQDRPEAPILNILTLRTMQQAHYSENNVGHFGLGFSHYSHFTSPIRRYPDLIAHRLIKSELYPKYSSMRMAEEDLAAATNWLSACEQRSVKAERKVISIKKARFMRKFEGEEFDGIISSVAKFGVFVLLRQYDVDGLIRIENLGNDRFMFDEENLRLIGQRTGKRFVIGDQIRIQVVNANPEDGRIDFVLAEDQKESSEHDDDEHDGSEFDFSDLDEFGDLKIRETTMGHSHKTKGKSQVRGKESGRGGVSGGKKANRKELKAKRFGDKKRSPPENDSRGVRKKRLSKRR